MKDREYIPFIFLLPGVLLLCFCGLLAALVRWHWLEDRCLAALDRIDL